MTKLIRQQMMIRVYFPVGPKSGIEVTGGLTNSPSELDLRRLAERTNTSVGSSVIRLLTLRRVGVELIFLKYSQANRLKHKFSLKFNVTVIVN